MKKNFIYQGLMLIAALAFVTNCSKPEQIVEDPVIDNNEEVVPVTGVYSELIAMPEETKTSTEDAVTINWVANDDLNVFVFAADAVPSSESDYDNYKYTVSNTETGLFATDNGPVLEPTGTYDWYVLYPYSSYIKTPAGVESTHGGYVGIGSKNKGTNQVQEGNDSKAHLAGQYFPMYGKAVGVVGDELPNVALKQALSVVRVRVTNANDADLTVSSVSFTGTEDIVGTYYINFAGETPVFTKSGETYVSNTANLTVNGGAAIAKGESADFYIAFKPFTAPSGETLTLSVNGYEKELVLSKDVVFSPGKIKTMKFSYDKVSTAMALPVQDDFSRIESDTDSDGTGALDAEALNENLEDDLYSAVSGKVYKGKSGYGLKFGSSSVVGSITTVDLDLSSAFYIEVSAAKYGTDNSQLEFYVNGTKVYTSSNLGADFGTYYYNADAATDASKIEVKVAGKRGYIKSFKVASGAHAEDPMIVVTSANPMAVTKDNDLYAIEYTITNPVVGKSISAAADVAWIHDFDYSTEGEVSFEVDAQDDDKDARSGKITLSYEGAQDVVVTVNQASSKPVINVTSDNPMAVSNDDDVYIIDYTIVNSVVGREVTATSNVAWIHDFDYDEGEVGFVVDAQETDAPARAGEITLKYTGAEDVVITVNQAAGPSSGGESLKYTLDGTITGGSSGYATESDIEQNEISWKVMGNTTMNPWRIGGKSISEENRTIYSTTAISSNISQIVVDHGAASSITVNSMTVIVSKNADFSDPVSTLTPTFEASTTVNVDRPDGKDWSNCYYKIIYNVTVSGNSNKFIEFKGAKFYGTGN